jgi:hypothetical protein
MILFNSSSNKVWFYLWLNFPHWGCRLVIAFLWTPNTSLPGSKKIIPRRMSASVSINISNLLETRIANLAANVNTIAKSLRNLQKLLQRIQFPQIQLHWGYGSGITVVKVPEWGEFVLAEKTQTFDKPDVSYFLPLMHQSEQMLGFRPRFGTFDAAFDAFYVYEYFHRADDPDAFAAVPFSEKGGYKNRKFSPEGLPICAAGLPMPLLFSFTDRTTTIVEHERGKYVYPFFSKGVKNKFIKKACPIHHKRAHKGGCTAMMPLSIGARLRYSLDRQSPAYKEIYNQRSATERLNSQAVNLGIERPHFRNGNAITNINTLTYALINLRLLQRIRHRLKLGE